MVSPTRAQGPQYPPMVRQGSLYNLSFDEVQSQLGNTGKPLHGMNLDDELQQNVISAENGQQLVQNPSSDHHHSFILGNIGLNGTLSNKTISEVWRGIVHQEHMNRSVEHPSLGETTLENFLARAGVINVGNQDNLTQPLMGIDPMVMPSQQEHWLQLQMQMQMQMQIPAINIHQQQQQHEEQDHQQIIGLCPDFSVSSKSSVYENPVMEIGYSENSVAISMSSACSDSKSAIVGKKNRYSDEVLEKTIERRQKRMAKNRESAARSRAKKQVSTKSLKHAVTPRYLHNGEIYAILYLSCFKEHINKLEKDKCRLQKINTWLKKLKVHSAIHFKGKN
ncbi:hypothetical protein VNO77_31297 [Canavalia gladiata]|uniref:BZIP domain-containing protein n=1 Tax=Canavalia gladiata TaxID=3824 RepID=A0AAN9KQX5_CANGL